MKIIASLLAGLYYLASFIVYLATAAVYMWSIFLAWVKFGVLGGLGALLVPILGQITMAYIAWPSDFSTVCVWVLAGNVVLAAIKATLQSAGDF